MLDDGDLLGIFPEGRITRDGKLGEFKGGLMKILQTHPVPVVPLALHNLWGSFFSRIEGGTTAQSVVVDRAGGCAHTTDSRNARHRRPS